MHYNLSVTQFLSQPKNLKPFFLYFTVELLLSVFVGQIQEYCLVAVNKMKCMLIVVQS